MSVVIEKGGFIGNVKGRYGKVMQKVEKKVVGDRGEYVPEIEDKKNKKNKKNPKVKEVVIEFTQERYDELMEDFVGQIRSLEEKKKTVQQNLVSMKALYDQLLLTTSCAREQELAKRLDRLRDENQWLLKSMKSTVDELHQDNVRIEEERRKLQMEDQANNINNNNNNSSKNNDEVDQMSAEDEVEDELHGDDDEEDDQDKKQKKKKKKSKKNKKDAPKVKKIKKADLQKMIEQKTKLAEATIIWRIRTNELCKESKHVWALMREYRDEIGEYEGRRRRQTIKQLRMIDPRMDEERLDEVLDECVAGSGVTHSIFAEAIMRERNPALCTLEYLEEKKSDIDKIERTMVELNGLAMDMNRLVDAQQEVLDTIELEIQRAEPLVEAAVENLKETARLVNNKRMKKFLVFLIGAIVLVIIVVVVAVAVMAIL